MTNAGIVTGFCVDCYDAAHCVRGKWTHVGLGSRGHTVRAVEDANGNSIWPKPKAAQPVGVASS